MNLRTTVVGGADMIGDLLSPVGTRPWCVGAKFRIQELLDQHEFDHKSIESLTSAVIEYSAWTQLSRQDGKPFESYTEFCKARRPFGLGRSDEDINRIIAEGKAKSAAQLVREAPREVGPGQGTRTDLEPEPRSDRTKLSRGENAPYLAARLNRDHPDIAARVEAGEFKSIRAAAIEAGIIRVPSKLQLAQKAFVRLNGDDRLEFIAWMTTQVVIEPRAC